MSGRWFLKRLLSSFVVLAAVLVLNFLLFRMMPGDAVSTIIDPSFSPEAKENLRALYGLDRPLWEQFVIYIRQMLTFSFALNRGRLAEKIVLRASAVTSSFPGFFVQLVLLMLFARALPIFPLRGTLSVPPPTGALGIFLDYGWHLALPVLSLSLMGFGGWALYVRNLMVRALNEDFALMARARGLSRGRVVWHAFRTILPPILTILLMSVPGLVSGAVITESVFSLHGVGTFQLEAISGHDYPSAGASFYLLALITVFCNLLADITYGLVDPRVRIEGKVQ